jgi:hypothetical protein
LVTPVLEPQFNAATGAEQFVSQVAVPAEHWQTAEDWMIVPLLQVAVTEPVYPPAVLVTVPDPWFGKIGDVPEQDVDQLTVCAVPHALLSKPAN